MQYANKKSFGITGSTFKIIACIIMFIDHIGAVIIERYLRTLSGAEFQRVYEVDKVVRYVGRLAFPMFCFLLVEGFLHTRSKMKYVSRLFIFCLISEIPFNLAIAGSIWDREHQNVLFTLLIGFGVLILIEKLEKRFTNHWLQLTGMVLIAMAGAALADYFMTDYGASGIITIFAMYILRNDKLQQMLMGCIVLTAYNSMEWTSLFALIPTKLYNGQKGMSVKFLFYLFYPLHLLLLYGISVWIGLA